MDCLLNSDKSDPDYTFPSLLWEGLRGVVGAHYIVLTHFIFRTLIDESPNSTSVTEGRLSVAVSLGTYKLFYAADSEDVFIRRTSSERESVLRARALAREEERRRTKWLK